MSVEIAASAGLGLIVQGDSIANQGCYYVPPHSVAINEVIATADATNPRVDSVVVEIKDDGYDGSALNLVRTRVLTGTPIAAVTKDAPGASPAAVPSSAMLIGYVQVDAGATSISTAKCRDMRPTVDQTVTGNLAVAGAITIAGRDVEAAFSSYKPLRTAATRMAAADVGAGGVYAFGGALSSNAIPSNTTVRGIFYFDPADYAASTRSTKLRLRASCAPGATPGTTVVVGLYPVTSILAGAATFGAVVTGSTASLGTPTANTLANASSGDFTAPSAGYYTFAFAAGAAFGGGADLQLDAMLQFRQV
jgi:hypothetical protein